MIKQTITNYPITTLYSLVSLFYIGISLSIMGNAPFIPVHFQGLVLAFTIPFLTYGYIKMVDREKQDNHKRKVQKSLDSYDVNKPLEEEDYFEEVLKDLS